MQNIETAQRGIVGGIRIELEWYDENELDIERLFNELSVREDVDAVIGPFYSEHTWVAARQCAKYNKTLFTIFRRPRWYVVSRREVFFGC